MNHDILATILLVGLPYAWAVKAAVFLVLSITLVMQRPQSRLGIVINGLFVATFLTSLWTTWLLTYLTQDITSEWLSTTERWNLVILGNIFPWIVNAFGISVTYYTHISNPVEHRDDRDKRQEATQEVLDETSLVLAKRGKKLSDAGISLDNRILQLGKDRRVADKREHDLDVREEGE